MILPIEFKCSSPLKRHWKSLRIRPLLPCRQRKRPKTDCAMETKPPSHWKGSNTLHSPQPNNMDLSEPTPLSSAKHSRVSAHRQTIISPSFSPLLDVYHLPDRSNHNQLLNSWHHSKETPAQKTITTKWCHSVAISFVFNVHIANLEVGKEMEM